MAERNNDKKKARMEEVGRLVGEAIIITVSGPDSGQPELTEEDKERIKNRVGEAFAMFMEHTEWKNKTDPVINEFKKAFLPKLLKQRVEDKVSIDEAIKEAFPSLDAEFEAHAIINMVANLAAVGPFKKIKDETLAKIVEENYVMIGLAIAYLKWRVDTTTPSKSEQH